MTRKLLHTLFATALSTGLLTTAAFADSVALSFSNATQSASATQGGTVTFTATISAPATNAGPEYLNGDTITFQGPLDISFDDSGLFNFDYPLNPGQSDTEKIFTAAVPAGETPGDYNGFYVLEGGSTSSSQDVLGTYNFTIDVGTASPPTVTPEPSSWLLLGTGCLGVFGLASLRRFGTTQGMS